MTNNKNESPPAESIEQGPGFQGQIAVFLIKLFGLLPLSLARWLGARVSSILWKIGDRSAQVTRENLRIAYPDMDETKREQLAYQSMLETGRLGTEICVVHMRDLDWVQGHIYRTEGEDVIDEALDRGKGVIILAPHLGNWELLGNVLITYGKLTILYQPPKQPYLESVIKEAREKHGTTTVPTTHRGVASLLKKLREGGITGILPDQIPNEGSGEYAPFFGEPAYTMTAVHGFLQRTDASAVFAFAKRVDEGFEIHFRSPSNDIYSEDLATSLKALNKGVEECIAYCPEQYQWEYKRFKRKDQHGENVHYKKRI
ncbi:MAG: lysophospholipid acyltransferase family protein [Agarilytica sp.]